MQASKDSTPVHDLSHAGHVLTNFQSWQAGLDGTKLAANFSRRVHLHVVHVLMGGGPAHVDHDHRLVRRTNARCLFSPQQSWERKPTHRKRANSQQIPTGDTVAEPA